VNSDTRFFQVIKEHVVFGNHAVVKSIKEDVSLDEPVYAINWFNTRSRWMYDFYNILASRSVYKIGGKVFFKGTVAKTLRGTNENSREVLLIVNYPSGVRFLDLMKDWYFIVVSVLRELAVKQFSFGFTQRLDRDAVQQNGNIGFDRSKSFAIHHFKTDKPVPAFIPMIQMAAESKGIVVYYAGQTSSLLFAQNKAGKDTQIPCLLDGLLVFEGDKDSELENFLSSDYYQKNIAQFDSSYMALLNRIM
jgi:hypothetical protein